MKYIKKFENIRFKYKKGDHVIGIDVKVVDELCKYLENNVGVIMDIDESVDNYYYIVKYKDVSPSIRIHMQYSTNIYKLSERDGAFPLHEEELRLATPKEIELQKIKPSAYKYNL